MTSGVVLSIIKQGNKTIDIEMLTDDGGHKRLSNDRLLDLKSDNSIVLHNAIIDKNGFVRKKSGYIGTIGTIKYKAGSNNKNKDIYLIKKIVIQSSFGIISKGWYKIKGNVYLVKGSYGKDDYNPFAEVIGSRIAYKMSGGYAIPYYLDKSELYPEIRCKLPYVSVCNKWEYTSTITMYRFAETINNSEVKDYYQWILRNCTDKQVYYISLMLFIDTIIGNMDRHLNNWEFDIVTKDVTKFIDFGNSCLSDVSSRVKYKSGKITPDTAKPFDSTHTRQAKKVLLLLKKHNLKLNVPDIEKAILTVLDLNNKDIKDIHNFNKNYYNKVKEYLLIRAERFKQEYKECLIIKG